MTTRAHFFLSALVGTMLLNRLYSQTQLSGFVTTGLLIAWLAHLADLLLDSKPCRRLKWMAIPMTAMAMVATSYFTDDSNATWGWGDCILMPLAVAIMVLIPVHRCEPSPTSNELPEA